jgi:hypothetical protein
MIQCHECRRIIMDSTDGGWKLRTRMVLFDEDGAKAICPSCKAHVDVPVTLGDVGTPLPKPKMYIANNARG